MKLAWVGRDNETKYAWGSGGEEQETGNFPESLLKS